VRSGLQEAAGFRRGSGGLVVIGVWEEWGVGGRGYRRAGVGVLGLVVELLFVEVARLESVSRLSYYLS
jgi:hypothetical protein